jgi:hypothetical protein
MGGVYLPPQLTEFKHLNGKNDPNLKDCRKAVIEQTHLSTHKKNADKWERNAAMQKF